MEGVHLRSAVKDLMSSGLQIGDEEAEARVVEGSKVLVSRLSRSKYEIEMPMKCVLESRGVLTKLKMQPQLEEARIA